MHRRVNSRAKISGVVWVRVKVPYTRLSDSKIVKIAEFGAIFASGSRKLCWTCSACPNCCKLLNFVVKDTKGEKRTLQKRP